VLHEQVGFERVGMVVVERRSFFQAQVVAIAVIAVVFEDDDLLGSEAVHDPADNRGLAGARAAGNADDGGNQGHRDW